MILVLNDQGGRVMSIDEDKTATLRAQEHGHQPVICFSPGIMERLWRKPVTDGTCLTLRANAGDNKPAVCYAADLYNGTITGERCCSLNANTGASANHAGPSIIICVEGHIVDRNTSQNGKGWAEGYAHTLNATDRHAVCYAIDCRNATLTGDVTHTIQAKANGGISLNCTPSVLIVDNHPQDSRVTLNNTGVVQTLSAQMGLGGGNTPMIMYCATRYAEYKETNPTLRASGGDIGGEVKD